MEVSLGIIETRGFAAAISAAEVILEGGKIELFKIDLIGAGIVSQFFRGDYALLNEAFNKAVKQARDVGEITSLYVTKNFNRNIEEQLFGQSGVKPAVSSSEGKKNKRKEKSKEVYVEQYELRMNEPNEEKSVEKEVIKTPSVKVFRKPSIASSTIQRLREEALSSVAKNRENIGAASEKRRKLKEINLNKLAGLNVHELRKAARSFKSFPIQGRQISRANRKELMKYFEELS